MADPKKQHIEEARTPSRRRRPSPAEPELPPRRAPSAPLPAVTPPPRAEPRPAESPLRDGDGRTHLVANQPPSIAGYDALTCDPALTDAVAREGAGGQ